MGKCSRVAVMCPSYGVAGQQDFTAPPVNQRSVLLMTATPFFASQTLHVP